MRSGGKSSVSGCAEPRMREEIESMKWWHQNRVFILLEEMGRGGEGRGSPPVRE